MTKQNQNCLNICIFESRIRALETKEAVMGEKIDNLTEQLKKMTDKLDKLFWVSIPTVVSLIGFLVSYWVKN